MVFFHALLTGIVSVTFFLSGMAKIAKPREIMESMAQLRVPRPLRNYTVALVLPFWELGLAVSLVLASGALLSISALLTLSTLIVFTALVLMSLWKGESVECNCFGILSKQGQITKLTAVRNVLLTASSAVILVLYTGAGSLLQVLTSGDQVFVLWLCLSWSIIVSIILGISSLIRPLSRTNVLSQSGRQRHGPESLVASIGDEIPDVELVSSTGVPRSLSYLGGGEPTLVLFLSANCGTCVDVSSLIPKWSKLLPVRIVVATSSMPSQVRISIPEAHKYSWYGAKAAREKLGIYGSPAAVLLGGSHDPVLASPVVYGNEQIVILVQSILAAHRTETERSRPKIE